MLFESLDRGVRFEAATARRRYEISLALGCPRICSDVPANDLGLGKTPELQLFAAFAFSIFNLVSTEVFDRQSRKQVSPFSLRL